MEITQALITGIVQGLTEVLPIASSAHLRIVGEFLPSATDPGAAFTAITQIGTEAAAKAPSKLPSYGRFSGTHQADKVNVVAIIHVVILSGLAATDKKEGPAKPALQLST